MCSTLNPVMFSISVSSIGVKAFSLITEDNMFSGSSLRMSSAMNEPMGWIWHKAMLSNLPAATSSSLSPEGVESSKKEGALWNQG